MIRKDKLTEKAADDCIYKQSSDPDMTFTVHDLEDRALTAFSDKKKEDTKDE